MTEKHISHETLVARIRALEKRLHELAKIIHSVAGMAHPLPPKELEDWEDDSTQKSSPSPSVLADSSPPSASPASAPGAPQMTGQAANAPSAGSEKLN